MSDSTAGTARRRASVAPWACAGVNWVLVGFCVALAASNGSALRNADLVGSLAQAIVPGAAIALVGGLTASRLPRNPIGWLLLAGAASSVVSGLAGAHQHGRPPRRARR